MSVTERSGTPTRTRSAVAAGKGRPPGIARDDRGWRRVGVVVLVLLSVFYGVPLLWMLATSLKQTTDMADGSWLPLHPTFAAYTEFFRTDFLPALRNSVQLSVSTTVLTMLLAIPAAYGLSRMRSWMVTPAMVLLLVVQMIPTSATFIPLFRLLARIDLINTLWGVALAQATLFIPFAVLILRPAFRGIPIALEEAAMLDGAGRVGYLVRIALPLLRNSLIVTTAIVLVSSWGELVYPLTFLLEQDKYPLSVYIAQSVGRFNNTWNLLMSVSVMASLPVLIVVLAAQRRLASGVTLGAVK